MDLAAFKELNRRALDVTDELGIHREAVSIPLDFEGEGAVRFVDPDRVTIIGPDGPLDPFLAELPDALRALGLDRLRAAEE